MSQLIMNVVVRLILSLWNNSPEMITELLDNKYVFYMLDILFKGPSVVIASSLPFLFSSEMLS